MAPPRARVHHVLLARIPLALLLRPVRIVRLACIRLPSQLHRPPRV